MYAIIKPKEVTAAIGNLYNMKKIQPTYEYHALVKKVVDGDTIIVRVDLGFKTWVEKTLRLARINAPELSTPAGIVASDYVNKYLLIDNDGAIVFTSKKLDMYGRSIAEIQVENKPDELFLSDVVVSSGNAVYKKY